MDLMKWAHEKIDPRVNLVNVHAEAELLRATVTVPLSSGELLPIGYGMLMACAEAETWDMLAERLKDGLNHDLEEKRARVARLKTITLDDEDRQSLDDDFALERSLRTAAHRVEAAGWKRVLAKHGIKHVEDHAPYFESSTLNEKHQYVELRIDPTRFNDV